MSVRHTEVANGHFSQPMFQYSTAHRIRAFGGRGDRRAVHDVAVAVARHDHELVGGARLKLVDGHTQCVIRHDLHRLPPV